MGSPPAVRGRFNYGRGRSPGLATSGAALPRRTLRTIRLGPILPRAHHGQLALIVYPFDLNPYQEMLYGAIRENDTHCVVRYVRRRAGLGPLPFFAGVGLARMRGFRLIHIHWPQFALRHGGRTLYRFSLVNARASLWWLRVLGIRIVWTVHNVLPHERETADDVMVSRMLARNAARTIVHSERTRKELSALGADTERVSVIPHGPYTGTYQEVSRTEGRRALQLPDTARIAMFFGQIRPYKGVEDLIDAWEQTTLGHAWRTRMPFLLLAGKCDDLILRQRLQRYADTVSGRFDQGYVAEKKVSLYFAAATIVVFPFRSVTTSGSALLALSLGRPIVAPRLGALRDLPDEVGFFYEPGGLAAALRRAIGAPDSELELLSTAARNYARSLSWTQIADSTLELYREVSHTTS